MTDPEMMAISMALLIFVVIINLVVLAMRRLRIPLLQLSVGLATIPLALLLVPDLDGGPMFSLLVVFVGILSIVYAINTVT